MPSDTPLPLRRLNTPEAARFVGLSYRTLEKHRSYGTGPVYEKIGGRVVYSIADLEVWLSRGRRQSTKEQTADEILPAKRHSMLMAGDPDR
jgi:predicted DNA-binding transcriptional regulator AlpA